MFATLRTWALLSIVSLLPTSVFATIERHAVINGSDQILVLEPNHRITNPDDPATHFQGHLKDHPNSWVRVTRLGDEWDGLLAHNGQLYQIHDLQVSASRAAAVKSAHLEPIDGLTPLGTCAANFQYQASGKTALQKALTVNGIMAQAATIDYPADCTDTIDGVCLAAELTVFFDTSFKQAFPTDYQSRGGEILNIIDGFYQNELQMVFKHLRIDYTNGDQFGSSENPRDILNTMIQKRINKTVQPSDPNIRSLMHLVTARDFLYDDGITVEDNVVGLANGTGYVPGTDPLQFDSKLCSTQGEAVSTTQLLGINGRPSATLTAVVVAHELGHNLGMEHDGDPDSATATACTDTDHIMYFQVVPGATQFTDCSKYAANLNVSALSQVEACFDFPVEIALTGDGGNIDESDANTTSQHVLNLAVQTANGFDGNVSVSGNMTAGDATIESVTLAGNSCSITGASKTYTCSALASAASGSLNVTFTTGSQNVTLTHTAAAGTNLLDMNSTNNVVTSVVEVKGPGLKPTNLTLSHNKSNNGIRLQWQDHSSDETAYQVERKLAGGSWIVIVDNLAANTEQYIDLDTRAGTKITYRVSALIGGISTETSNEASISYSSNNLRDHRGTGGSGGSLPLLTLAALLIHCITRLRTKNNHNTCTI